ncbi:hypothetical protein M404DRAFT_999115 [Pisolithus tinctorius Marx 270]|uniref:Uncharacterized protein n=1 Tax=Pisolithus tinctorius Marx 270 TaxID=870435 RepID=A0A0C3P021_PISTI|nr:hypothetical protein M404DRAFT_999115 [Pisolithus tinctorius Marx 270]
MRLYAIYHGSKKILFTVLLGFMAEIAIMIACMVQITKFEVGGPSNVTYRIRVYPNISYATVAVYECLLFALAVYAAIRHHREERVPLPVNLKDLRTILIGGNVVYFLGTLLYIIAYLVVTLMLSTQWIAAVPRLGFAITAVIGCHLVLHVRSSRTSTSTRQVDSQEHESYPLAVLHDHSTPAR